MKFNLILAFLILIIGCGAFKHPSDTDMKQKFLSNKEDFFKLVKMLEEDKKIVRLDYEDVFYSDNSRGKISEEKLNEYRSLLRKLKLEAGIHRDNISSVRLIASTNRLSLSNSEKSFLYSIDDVSPIVESLDQEIANDYGDHPPAYKKIDNNWYLVYESW